MYHMSRAGSDVTSCTKIDKSLLVYVFRNVIKSKREYDQDLRQSHATDQPMHGRIKKGEQGVRTPPPPPLKNHKNIGILSKTGLEILENHKATKLVFSAH